MAEVETDMALQQEDLNETDEGVLRLLADGRCSPRYLAEELDRQQPYISQRLKRLVEHGHVRRVDRGLYELTDSPTGTESPTTLQISDELADELHRRKKRSDAVEDVIWRLIETEDDVEPVTADGTTDTERKAEVYDDLAEESAAEDAGDVQDDVEAFVERVSGSWEDTEERLASRRAAAEVVLQHALDTGDAVGKSSDVVEDVRERFPVEGQNAETYWRKNIRPVLKEAGEYSQAQHGYVVEALDS